MHFKQSRGREWVVLKNIGLGCLVGAQQGEALTTKVWAMADYINGLPQSLIMVHFSHDASDFNFSYTRRHNIGNKKSSPKSSLKETKFPFYACAPNQFRQVWPLHLSYRICLRWVCRKTASFGACSMCSVTQVGNPRLLNALLGKGYLYFSGHVGFCSIEVSLDWPAFQDQQVWEASITPSSYFSSHFLSFFFKGRFSRGSPGCLASPSPSSCLSIQSAGFTGGTTVSGVIANLSYLVS